MLANARCTSLPPSGPWPALPLQGGLFSQRHTRLFSPATLFILCLQFVLCLAPPFCSSRMLCGGCPSHLHPYLPSSGPLPALPVQGGLPSDWGEERVKALLAPYGLLRSFNLMLDRGTGRSKVRGGGPGMCSFDVNK